MDRTVKAIAGLVAGERSFYFDHALQTVTCPVCKKPRITLARPQEIRQIALGLPVDFQLLEFPDERLARGYVAYFADVDRTIAEF